MILILITNETPHEALAKLEWWFPLWVQTKEWELANIYLDFYWWVSPLLSLYRFSPQWHVIKHTNRRTRPAASHSKKHIGYKNDCEGDETSFWILIIPGPALMTFILLSLPTVTLQYASIPDFFSISRQFWPLNNCPPPLMVAHWAQWLHGTAQHNPI